MAKFTSLNINGKPVKTLYIDGKQVVIGSEKLLGYLCFTAEESNSSVGLTTYDLPPEATFLTSTDGKTWNDYQLNDTINLSNIGDKVYFKAKSTNMTLASTSGDHEFFMTGKIAASGNINTLLTENLAEAKTMSLEGRDRCFTYLFYNCESLTQSPEFPATTLAKYCYDNMFNNCTSLEQAPELPAMTLTDFCYHQMFDSCSSLTQAPELKAETLAAHCYDGMFYGCSSLTQAPALPATTLAIYCYGEMFYDCESLTQAPELPATTLTDFCYNYMFYNCTNIGYIKVGFTNWAPAGATETWLPDREDGRFECPWELITNTSTRTSSTVPPGWTMVAV